MRYEDWQYHPSRLPKDLVEKENAIKQLTEQFARDLEQDPRVAEYLKPYDPKWAGKFIQDYAKSKAEAVRYSQYHIKAIEKERELRYREQTEEAYKAILSEKALQHAMPLARRADHHPRHSLQPRLLALGTKDYVCPFY